MLELYPTIYITYQMRGPSEFSVENIVFTTVGGSNQAVIAGRLLTEVSAQ